MDIITHVHVLVQGYPYEVVFFYISSPLISAPRSANPPYSIEIPATSPSRPSREKAKRRNPHLRKCILEYFWFRNALHARAEYVGYRDKKKEKTTHGRDKIREKGRPKS
jgi:hypothetical protein